MNGVVSSDRPTTMQEFNVFRSLEGAAASLGHPVVTIGNFDGVHVGHQMLLKRTRETAEQTDASAVALTFSPHPVRYFRPDADEFRLTTDTQKFELIREYGLDAVVALPFDKSLSELQPKAFVDQIIHDGLSARRVIVGANFAFGKNRAGSTDDLVRLADERGFAADVCEEVTKAGGVVSSTRIRGCIQQGDVAEAASLLGRNYRLSGTVVSGDGRGNELGFPTANLEVENLVPADGIYATYFHSEGLEALPAASSIGWRPTFDDAGYSVEAYILDHDDLELYGKHAEIEFVEYLRPEREFDSAESLIEQIQKDVTETRTVLSESN